MSCKYGNVSIMIFNNNIFDRVKPSLDTSLILSNITQIFKRIINLRASLKSAIRTIESVDKRKTQGCDKLPFVIKNKNVFMDTSTTET